MRDRVILHVDMNCFYASVETVLNPSLRGKPVAVCGSTEDRHGIVLAKSELAKRAGVKTGMVTYEAKKLCPGLIVVPPHHEMYHKFSALAKQIYLRYSDMVEPYGLDENWIDLTGAAMHFPSPEAAAEEIREAVKTELGLTVSVGVSFNKVFAKLASDLKKPDAVSVVNRENFREVVWPLPVGDLLFVGPKTAEKLELYGINTIGDLARADPNHLAALLGKNGGMIWQFACGKDASRVLREDEMLPVQSIGHGITMNQDVKEDEEVCRIFLELSQDIGKQLREGGFYATGIQIAVKDKLLETKQFDTLLPHRTQNALEIAKAGYRLYREKYQKEHPIRALTIRATRLFRTPDGDQYDLFTGNNKRERMEKLDKAVDDICHNFGRGAILPASVLLNTKTKSSLPYVSTLPHSFIGV